MPSQRTLLPQPASRWRRAASAVLRSPVGDFLDGLAAPHGLDRYLEQIDPLLARDVDRAVVTGVRRETLDTTTITLRPARWSGHRAGQFVEVGVEVEGRRHTRCYSISSSAHRTDGQFTITVKADRDGIVSPFLVNRIGLGTVVTISQPMGEFALPDARPERVLLVSGGSGITPVMSMLRTLIDEDAATQVTFLHYARSLADLAFVDELVSVRAHRENVDVVIVLTSETDGGPFAPGIAGHLAAAHVDAVLGDPTDVPVFACGPASLLAGATDLWSAVGLSEQLHLERFHLATIVEDDVSSLGGTISLTASDRAIVSDGRTILEQAEAAGLMPKSGCRMGICHTCITPLTSGQVRDVRDGRVIGSTNAACDQDVQLCVTVPVGDITLDL